MPFNQIKDQVSNAIQAQAQGIIDSSLPRPTEYLKDTMNYNKGPNTTSIEIDNNKFMAVPRAAWKYRELADWKDKANVIGGLAGFGGGLALATRVPHTTAESMPDQAKVLASGVVGSAMVASGIDRTMNASSIGDVVKGLSVSGLGAGTAFVARPSAVKALPPSTQLLLYGGISGAFLGSHRLKAGLNSIARKGLLGPQAGDPSLPLETKLEALYRNRVHAKDRLPKINPLLSALASAGFMGDTSAPKLESSVIDRMKQAELTRVLASLDHKPTKRERRELEVEIDNMVSQYLLANG